MQNRKAVEPCRSTNQVMNGSNISGNRSAGAASGSGAASEGWAVPVRSAPSRSQWPQQTPVGLTSDRRPSAASGASLAPRSHLPDWRSAPQSVPGGTGQSFAGSVPAGPQGWAGSVAATLSGGGGGWAESQIGSRASSTGYQPPQSPAASTDDVYSLLNDELPPSAFSWAGPTLQAGMGASTQHSGLRTVDAPGVGSSVHMSLVGAGSRSDGWVESQRRSMAPLTGYQPPQSPATSTDEVYSLLNDEHPPSDFSWTASNLPGGMGASTQHSGMRAVDAAGVGSSVHMSLAGPGRGSGGGAGSQMGGSSWVVTQSQSAVGATDQGDLASAIAPFLRPATTSAASQDANGRDAWIPPSVASSSRPADSSNAAIGNRTQSSRISRQEFEEWGRAVVSGNRISGVAQEINTRYGTPLATAKSWFHTASRDGLSVRGRRAAYPDWNVPGASLSEEQVRFIADGSRSGRLSVNDALTEIGQPDVSPETVRDWLDKNSEDGLSNRGRNVVDRIRKHQLYRSLGIDI